MLDQLAAQPQQQQQPKDRAPEAPSLGMWGTPLQLQPQPPTQPRPQQQPQAQQAPPQILQQHQQQQPPQQQPRQPPPQQSSVRISVSSSTSRCIRLRLGDFGTGRVAIVPATCAHAASEAECCTISFPYQRPVSWIAALEFPSHDVTKYHQVCVAFNEQCNVRPDHEAHLPMKRKYERK